MKNKMPQANKRTLSIAIAALLLLAPLAYAVWFELEYRDTAFPGTDLGGNSYTGLSRSEAEKRLKNAIEDTYKDGILLSYKDKTYILSLSELGYEINIPASVEKIFSYGHGNDLLRAAEEQAALLTGPVHFEYEMIRKDFLIEKNRREEIGAIETPAQNFSYEYDNGNFIPVAAEEGFIIDENRLKDDIENNLRNLKNNPIALQLVKEDPAIREDKGEEGLRRAKNLLTRDITLTYKENSWAVPKEDFGKWIGFAADGGKKDKTALIPAPKPEKIKEYLTSITPQINRAPVNATLEFKDGKVSVFALSQDGIELDAEKSIENINKTIFREEYFEKAATPGETAGGAIATKIEPILVELAIKSVEPELTTDNIDNLGLTKLLATGESDFHGSSKSRVHNVTVGASKFNGVLIGPGDTFSFNSILGEVGPNQGYLPELVIKQGKTIAEYGGGLCQVSTTAFRGAVAAGLEVTERTNHAYAVKYYSPQGTDATIYPPHPDLAFINNTPNYILIQTRISGTKLYFDYYGTDDGRKVETEGPVVYERGAGGAMKTWWKQRVYDKNGNLFLEKTFYSNYKPASLYPTTNPLE